jgi:hypothetical protein
VDGKAGNAGEAAVNNNFAAEAAREAVVIMRDAILAAVKK